jgi:DNA-binding transcriptional ArsR family regulator
MDKKRKKLENAVVLLKQVSHPVRLSILCNLIHQKEMNVTEIVASINGTASQSQVSQFLAKMREDKLVSSRKEGLTVYYKISSPEAQKLIQALYNIYCVE